MRKTSEISVRGTEGIRVDPFAEASRPTIDRRVEQRSYRPYRQTGIPVMDYFLIPLGKLVIRTLTAKEDKPHDPTVKKPYLLNI